MKEWEQLNGPSTTLLLPPNIAIMRSVDEHPIKLTFPVCRAHGENMCGMTDSSCTDSFWQSCIISQRTLHLSLHSAPETDLGGTKETLAD